MSRVVPNHQGLAEENILSFFGSDPVKIPILMDISFVPIESYAAF